MSITFAAWKEGRVAPGKGEVRVLEASKNAAVRAAPAVKAGPDRAVVANNLKQIGLAMHLYLDKHQTFPPAAIYGKDGKALLSWRVALLPYLEQEALYKAFKLDEPWDSPHNLKLAEIMVPVFAVPGVELKNNTTFHVFTGPGTMFEGTKGIGPAQVTDGLSNTILVIEGGPPTPWTKPADLVYDPKRPLPKISGVFENGFHILLGDGSVRMMSRTVGERVLRLAIERNDGMAFDADAPAAKKK